MSDVHTGALAHHFEDVEQQRETMTLGMWAFLASEVMFFGGLFASYLVYRVFWPDAFARASQHLDVPLGTFNTAVLILSSLTMALAVRSGQLGRGRQGAAWIAATAALALVFLGVKALEYAHKFHEGLVPGAGFGDEGTAAAANPDTELFFALYFAMTGMHALHMVIGLGIMAVVGWRSWRGRYGPDDHAGLEVTGLYWHFVDLVWIFLFPLLYLLGRHAS